MNKTLKYMIIDYLKNFHKDQNIIEKISAFQPDKYYKEYYKENSKYDPYEPIPEIASMYDNIELTQEQLLNTKEIYGDSTIFLKLMPFWDGEGEEFKLNSLDGIEKLSNLEGIFNISFKNIHQQEQLLKLHNLKEICCCEGINEEIKQQLIKNGVTIID